MSAWPVTLPRPLIADYRLAPAAQTARTDMEVGAPRVRRRTAARADEVALEWLMTEAQFVQFRTWFDDAAGAAGGAAWITGLGLAVGAAAGAAEARFTAPWRAQAEPAASGRRWRVAATVEVR